MISHHTEEEEIANLSKDEKERKKQLDLLRFKGDYKRNMIVLKSGGELVLWRRPGPEDIVSIEDFIPCQFCFAFVTKAELWRHHKTCQFVQEGVVGTVQASRLLLFSHQTKEQPQYIQLKAMVIDKMNNDAVKKVVSQDEIIQMYGSFQLENGGLKKASSISDRMRVMAR